MVLRVAVFAFLTTASPRVASPCTISAEPQAVVYQPASGNAPGHQPWIRLWRVSGRVDVTQVPATCGAGTICRGSSVPYDRSGNFLRPRAPLADGARIQISSGKRLLADVTISTDPVQPLPPWAGVVMLSAAVAPEGLCSPGGPTVELLVNPTHANLDAAVLLVYLAKPDTTRPLAGLAQVVPLGGGVPVHSLGNGLGEPPWLRSVPNQLWVALADGDGQIGPVIAIP